MNSVMKNYDVPHRVENIIVEFIGPTERMEHTTLQRELRNKSFKKLGIEKKRIWAIAERRRKRKGGIELFGKG